MEVVLGMREERHRMALNMHVARRMWVVLVASAVVARMGLPRLAGCSHSTGTASLLGLLSFQVVWCFKLLCANILYYNMVLLF